MWREVDAGCRRPGRIVSRVCAISAGVPEGTLKGSRWRLGPGQTFSRLQALAGAAACDCGQ